jgi:hypothetical protein
MKGAVAMTRPKRHLCVIGDSETISKYVLSSFPIHIPSITGLPCPSHNRSLFVIAYSAHSDNVGVGKWSLRTSKSETRVTRNCRDTLPCFTTREPLVTHTQTNPSASCYTPEDSLRSSQKPWLALLLTWSILRGSKFLKAWMQHLEDHADLRYPNLADVYVDQENGG